jgi:hypothetical protein
MKKIPLYIIANFLVAFLLLNGAVAYANTTGETSQELSATTSVNMDRTLPVVKPVPKPLLKLRTELESKRASSTVRAEINIRKSSSTEDMRPRDRASSTKDKIGQIVRKIFRNRFENVIIRFGATIEREQSIMARIVSRIEKVKTAGGDTTKAESFIVSAKASLSEATTTLALLKAKAEVTAQLESDPSLRNASTTRDALENLHSLSQKLEKNLRDAHKALIGAVTNLLGMSTTKPKLQATTTTEVNTQN